MCFSATANFVGSGVLGAVGAVTLTKVKHRRELLFASLPLLFAVHQFIEGFVWLGLDGILSPTVTHNMGAAYMLYAQGLLPFLLPMSVLFFEPDGVSRKRMLPFLAVGVGTGLYILWVAYSVSDRDLHQRKQHRLYQPGDQQHNRRHPLSHRHLRLAVLLQSQSNGDLRRRKPRDSANRDRCQTLRVYLSVVRIRRARQRDRPRLFLENQPPSSASLRSLRLELMRPAHSKLPRPLLRPPLHNHFFVREELHRIAPLRVHHAKKASLPPRERKIRHRRGHANVDPHVPG